MLSDALRLILYLTIPASLGLIVLGKPLIQLLLQRGQFDSASTQAVAWALQFFALGLFAHSALEIVARAFYSLHDTRTPVLVGVGAMILNISLSLLLIGPMLHGGLALANSIAAIIETLLLLVILRTRLGGIEGKGLILSVTKTSLATLVMGSGVLWFQALALDSSMIIQAGGAMLFGGVLFVVTSLLLRSEELMLLRDIVKR